MMKIIYISLDYCYKPFNVTDINPGKHQVIPY